MIHGTSLLLRKGDNSGSHVNSSTELTNSLHLDDAGSVMPVGHTLAVELLRFFTTVRDFSIDYGICTSSTECDG